MDLVKPSGRTCSSSRRRPGPMRPATSRRSAQTSEPRTSPRRAASTSPRRPASARWISEYPAVWEAVRARHATWRADQRVPPARQGHAARRAGRHSGRTDILRPDRGLPGRPARHQRDPNHRRAFPNESAHRHVIADMLRKVHRAGYPATTCSRSSTTNTSTSRGVGDGTGPQGRAWVSTRPHAPPRRHEPHPGDARPKRFRRPRARRPRNAARARRYHHPEKTSNTLPISPLSSRPPSPCRVRAAGSDQDRRPRRAVRRPRDRRHELRQRRQAGGEGDQRCRRHARPQDRYTSNDTQTNPGVAKALAQKAVDNNAYVVIGPVFSGWIIVSIAKSAAPRSRLHRRRGGEHHAAGRSVIFRTSFTQATTMPKLAKYIKDTLKAKNIAIVSVNNDFGKRVTTRCRRRSMPPPSRSSPTFRPTRPSRLLGW